MTEKCDRKVDLAGAQCPYSLLELNAVFRDMAPGETVEILSTRASIVDEIRRWSAGTGNEVVGVETVDRRGAAGVRVVLRKA